MAKNKHIASWLTALFCLASAGVNAQDTRLCDGITAVIEAQGVTSSGDYAPLWLVSNRHGLVSPYDNSAYERVAIKRELDTDSTRRWRRSFGVDIVMSQNAQSKFMVHQAYAQLQWLKTTVTVGAKERDIDLRNQTLTSGGLSLGNNAAPLPMIRGEVDYFGIPCTNNWWQWRGRMAYGMTTDASWQEDWVGDKEKMRYTSNSLYHEKALYWRFGREDVFPLTYEIGIQMMTLFGGTTYNISGRGIVGTITLEHPKSLNAFWHAFWPMGSSDVTDGVNLNAAGNTVGSYNMRLQWKDAKWAVGAYFERYYEDHSMLTLQYGIYDHLVGIDATLPKNKLVSHALVEHISTKDQSGPLYHDGTTNIPDAVCGRDNYYNHNLYTGWQHWGMAIGNPLITSPVYNSDHQLRFKNNRIQAWHIGLDGAPCRGLQWRAMATFTQNWGTYSQPCADKLNEQHYMFETTLSPSVLPSWQATAAFGLSHGKLIGNTCGVQLSVRKRLRL